jgi:hypothetical protein
VASPSLVVKAYWRQQVGYGEGERWLMAHHPEKFLDGHMLWRGRIYSPLPFVRSLWGERINAGVWGTAAFPSVYRHDVHPFAFLPHSIRWQVLSFAARRSPARGGRIGGHAGRRAAARTRTRSGLRRRSRRTCPTRGVGRGFTARQSTLVPRGGRLPALHPAVRTRSRGQIRGIFRRRRSSNRSAAPDEPRPRPSLRESARAMLLICGSVTEDRYWSETWTNDRRVLDPADRLARGLARRSRRRGR